MDLKLKAFFVWRGVRMNVADVEESLGESEAFLEFFVLRYIKRLVQVAITFSLFSLGEKRREEMLVTDKFVFVHLPRSGGTFVSEVIRKFFPSAHEIGYHLPRVLLPREYSHLPVLGGVRNPWEFYASWYHHSVFLTPGIRHYSRGSQRESGSSILSRRFETH